MTDPILARFSDMTDRYPGSKEAIGVGRQQRQQRQEEQFEDDEPEWAVNPYFRREVLLEGQKVVMYTLQALAQALQRGSVETIRLWERRGVFPMANYRTPENGPGKRLYTREQIEGVVAIATDLGILHGRRPIPQEFTRRVMLLFARTTD